MNETFKPEFEDSIKKYGHVLIITKLDNNFVKLKMLDNYSNIIFEKIFKMDDKNKFKKIIELFKEHPLDNKAEIVRIVENENEYESF